MGIILDYTGDSPNISTGDFSGLILQGNLIENGEIKHPLNETMVAINLIDLFMNIDAISKEFKIYGSFQASLLLSDDEFLLLFIKTIMACLNKKPIPQRDGYSPAVPPFLARCEPTLHRQLIHNAIGPSKVTVRLRSELLAASTAFPRTAQEGTSPRFYRARVAVIALASLTTSSRVLSSVIAFRWISFIIYEIWGMSTMNLSMMGSSKGGEVPFLLKTIVILKGRV